MTSRTIVVTHTDESPELSAVALLPILEHFFKASQIELTTIDISLANRILAAFPEYMEPQQRRPDDLKTLRGLVEHPDAVVIKLPNDSATTNQLVMAIAELQAAGFALPTYPEQPQTDEEQNIRRRYDALTGSVVNPVMRQGNAIRSIPAAVKDAARKEPHAMGVWRGDSATHVQYMNDGDFYRTETSTTLTSKQAGEARIEFVSADGKVTVLKSIHFSEGEIVDAALMSRESLHAFLEDAITQSREKDRLLSFHFKATMMKNTDGVFFGDAVKIFFKDLFEKYSDEFAALNIDSAKGLSDIRSKIQRLDPQKRAEIEADIAKCLAVRAPLAMTSKDITHLDSPNNVIIDVSMANLARWGGLLQDATGHYRDTMAIIPDSTYARMHEVGIEVLKRLGSPDPKTMGTVTAVRLQANGAEEYGSRDTTFEAKQFGTFRVVTSDEDVLHSHQAKAGDIWRMCRTEDSAVRNWAQLALEQTDLTNDPVIFWLDQKRPHDAQIIKKVKSLLSSKNNAHILSPQDAMKMTLERVIQGKNSVAVTGNLVGDHITDYFPIMEVGSSAKMLSVIKLLNGGLVAETGSGGTAPDLLNMLEEKNHFLWDDLGTALAVVEALKHINESCAHIKAGILARTLQEATLQYVSERRSPALNGLDTRQSQFYLATYWAKALARQNEDPDLRDTFQTLSAGMTERHQQILSELTQDGECNLGGRYYFDPEIKNSLMRPSSTLNDLIHS